MAEKFVPYSKMSPREKRRIDALSRRGWGDTSPVTRTVRSARAYSRKVKHKGREYQ